MANVIFDTLQLWCRVFIARCVVCLSSVCDRCGVDKRCEMVLVAIDH